MNGENNENVFGLPGDQKAEPEMPVAPPPVIAPPKAEVPPGAEDIGETKIEDAFYEVSLAMSEQIAATHAGATPPRAAQLNIRKFIVRLAAKPLKPETKVCIVAFPVSKDGKLGGAMAGFDGSTSAFFRGSADCIKRLLGVCKSDEQKAWVRQLAKAANVREEPSQIEDLMVVAGHEPREIRAFANKYKGYFQDLHDAQVASKAARVPQA